MNVKMRKESSYVGYNGRHFDVALTERAFHFYVLKLGSSEATTSVPTI